MLLDKPKDKKMLQLPSLQNILQLGFLSQWQRQKNPFYVTFRGCSHPMLALLLFLNTQDSVHHWDPMPFFEGCMEGWGPESHLQNLQTPPVFFGWRLSSGWYSVNCESLAWALDYSYIKGNQTPGPVVDSVRPCTRPWEFSSAVCPQQFGSFCSEGQHVLQFLLCHLSF